MHLTWLPGDPVIQLNFPNPLNVSVQVGDVAYFSNPTAVGQPQEWTATTTPHLANPQSGVIMIGEIVQIIPWNGTVSSIICNMPQALFNQYFAQIIAGGCVSVPSGNPTCTGNCCNFDTSYSSAVAVPQTGDGSTFFFDNPTLSMGANALGGPNCYMIHATTPTPGIYDSVSVTNNWCLLDNNHPNYVPGHINYWSRVSPFYWTDENGLEWGPFLTAGLLIDFLIGLYPTAGFFQGMSFDDLANARNNIPGFPSGVGWSIGGGPSPITGTYSDTYTETCTQGSFIMFSKDNKVNMSDMLGYYASVELRNSSTTEAELFNVGTTFFESSK